ncbi:MAG: flavin reductase family protein [Acidobacteriia bacterium]|nr:flavin reductase family protein [Terriglobia bacterium]
MDAEAKKKVLRMINYGLYVLSAKQDAQVAAATVNWLSQASFNPPLVMVGLKKDSQTYQVVLKSMHFTVNVLGKEQKNIAQDFFKPSTVEGSKINGHAFAPSGSGGAVLDEAPSWFECKVTDIIDRGDHAVVVAEVIEAKVIRDEPPMFMRDTGWFYGG